MPIAVVAIWLLISECSSMLSRFVLAVIFLSSLLGSFLELYALDAFFEVLLMKVLVAS